MIKNTLFSFIANRFKTERLCSCSNSLIIHPFYHTVTDNYLPHLTPLYKPKSVKEFQLDIDYLYSHFQAICIDDVLSYTEGNKKLEKNAFHLSFDDGLREVYTTVLPILYQKGIPATIFINSDFVDNKNLFYRHKAALIIDLLNKKVPSENSLNELEKLLGVKKAAFRTKILAINYSEQNLLDKIASVLNLDLDAYLKTQQPYLSKDELLEMQKKGFTIAAHSINHPPFSELKEEEQIRQVLESNAYVSKTFQASNNYFSFPFSDENIKDSVYHSIYETIDLSFGITGINTRFNGKHIARIDMEKYGKNAKEAINKAYLKSLIKQKTTFIN